MPSKIQVALNLENKYLKSAPKANREKIRRVIQIFRNNNNVTRNTAEKVVMSLYLPSAFGRVGRKGKPGKADEIFEEFISRYQQRRHRETKHTRTGNQEDIPAEGRALHTGEEARPQ